MTFHLYNQKMTMTFDQLLKGALRPLEVWTIS
jgi:hypothetical protein